MEEERDQEHREPFMDADARLAAEHPEQQMEEEEVQEAEEERRAEAGALADAEERLVEERMQQFLEIWVEDEEEEEEEEDEEEDEDEQPLDTEASESFEVDAPAERSGHVAVVDRTAMYVWGGYKIYRLALRAPTLTWEEMRELKGTPPSAKDKLGCWVYRTSEIIYFGGYGYAAHEHRGTFEYDESSSLVWDSPGRGWNNHVHVLDLETLSWSQPITTGNSPSPRAAHACATVGSRGYVFGGRYKNYRLNDLYYLDLDTWEWHEMSVPQQGPVGRSWHSFTPVSQDHIFLFGGFTTERDTLSDAWLYSVSQNQWKPLNTTTLRTPGCGTRLVPGLMEKCLCLEDVPTTCCPPESGSQQPTTDLQRPAQVSAQVLYGVRPAAPRAPVQLLGLSAQTPAAQPQAEDEPAQHAGILRTTAPRHLCSPLKCGQDSGHCREYAIVFVVLSCTRLLELQKGHRICSPVQYKTLRTTTGHRICSPVQYKTLRTTTDHRICSPVRYKTLRTTTDHRICSPVRYKTLRTTTDHRICSPVRYKTLRTTTDHRICSPVRYKTLKTTTDHRICSPVRYKTLRTTTGHRICSPVRYKTLRTPTGHRICSPVRYKTLRTTTDHRICSPVRYKTLRTTTGHRICSPVRYKTLRTTTGHRICSPVQYKTLRTTTGHRIVVLSGTRL
ncbi:hypothetical protein WMY93_000917 [Mugilogobius chulae]|uniref:Uncharacterized protein n=1 Tax=Mugilogobius chulae TaxID=88201 RepID=A0AAW0Q0L8_9GOBI